MSVRVVVSPRHAIRNTQQLPCIPILKGIGMFDSERLLGAWRTWVLGCACILVALVLGFASSASAKKVYVPGVSFGSEGSGNGQFKEPMGVAVNDSLTESAAGDVYVVDKGNDRVERFSSTGAYLGRFDGSGAFEVEGKAEVGVAVPTGSFSAPEQVAVDGSGKTVLEDPSVGDVYVLDPGHNVIDKFSSTGEYLSQFTPADACNPAQCVVRVEVSGATTVVRTGKRSETLTSMAVDPSGNLWTSDFIQEEVEISEVDKGGGTNKNLSEYRATYISECNDAGSCVPKFETREGLTRMAVDSNENVYALTEGLISAFDSATGKVVGGANIYNEKEEVFYALTVGSSMNDLFGARGVLVGRGGATSIAMYGTSSVLSNTSGAPQSVEQFPSEGLTGSFGVAVNASATVYASERGADNIKSFDYVPLPTVTTETPSNVSETAMTLHGTLNPEGEPVSECYFEYGTEPGKYTSKVACEQEPKTLVGTAALPVGATLTGLLSAGVRSVRLVAANANGTIHAVGVTISHPTTAGETFSNVGVIAATLDATIDPGGLATKYHVEYGTSTSYGASTPEEDIGSANQGVGVRVDLTGLQPGMQYHLRVVATNVLGAIDGPDVTFATYLAVAGLPDGRVYEPVSPVGSDQDVNIYIPDANYEITGLNEHGINASSRLPFQAAAGGEAVVYAGDPPPTGGTSAEGESLGNEYLATRAPGGGWTQVALETASQTEASAKQTSSHIEYHAFTSDLSVGILEGSSVPVTGAPLNYSGLYAHAMADGVDGGYEPLFTAIPDRTEEELRTAVNDEQVLYAGANAGGGVVRAYSHLLFESNADFLVGEGQLENEVREDVKQEVEAGKHSEFSHYLYDNVGGKLYLVDVLPNGSVVPGGAFGSVEEAVTGNGLAGGGPGFTHVISADGSRVFWTYAPEASTTKEGSEGDRVSHRSRALYVRENDTQPQSPVGPEEECLVAADACTVQVDKAVGGGGIFQGASVSGSEVFFTKGDLYEYNLENGQTTDLSPGVEVKGVAGISDDGEYVYYVDSNNNIVLWHAGVTALVADGAAISSDYALGGAATDYAEAIGSRTAEVTPDGHSLVFMSSASLTGYDNRSVKKEIKGSLVEVEEPIEEAFLYEAQSGKLTCVSCDPTGEAPVTTNASSTGITREGETFLVGAALPVSLQATYQPRWISEDGSRVFFESAQPLAPQATNGWLDVYEWERDGAGSCQQSQGCIFLLSSGSDPENSYLLDASANGSDVFMITRAQLVAQDRNDLDDVYDVRVDGVRPSVAPACAGTGCQGVPPAPPIFATPASVTFEGIGNFAAPPPANHSGGVKARSAKCRKGFVKRNGRCVKKRRAKRARRAARKAGRSSGRSRGRI